MASCRAEGKVKGLVLVRYLANIQFSKEVAPPVPFVTECLLLIRAPPPYISDLSQEEIILEQWKATSNHPKQK